jgi:hypothetical protein
LYLASRVCPKPFENRFISPKKPHKNRSELPGTAQNRAQNNPQMTPNHPPMPHKRTHTAAFRTQYAIPNTHDESRAKSVFCQILLLPPQQRLATRIPLPRRPIFRPKRAGSPNGGGRARSARPRQAIMRTETNHISASLTDLHAPTLIPPQAVSILHESAPKGAPRKEISESLCKPVSSDLNERTQFRRRKTPLTPSGKTTYVTSSGPGRKKTNPIAAARPAFQTECERELAVATSPFFCYCYCPVSALA